MSTYQLLTISASILMLIFLSPTYLILTGTVPLERIIVMKYFYLSVSLIGVVAIVPYWIFCLPRSFKRHPAVSLSEEGILETSWFFSPGLIRWSEIASFSIDHRDSKSFLVIITHDPQPILNRMFILKRLACRMNFTFERSPFMIPDYLIEGSLNELAIKIQDYYETHVKSISSESPGTPDSTGLTSIGGDSFAERTCPQCHDAKVSRPVNKTILLVSIVVFVVADVLYSIGGYLGSLAFYSLIIINALLTVGLSVYFRKYRCRNCGFVWK